MIIFCMLDHISDAQTEFLLFTFNKFIVLLLVSLKVDLQVSHYISLVLLWIQLSLCCCSVGAY